MSDRRNTNAVRSARRLCARYGFKLIVQRPGQSLHRYCIEEIRTDRRHPEQLHTSDLSTLRLYLERMTREREPA